MKTSSSRIHFIEVFPPKFEHFNWSLNLGPLTPGGRNVSIKGKYWAGTTVGNLEMEGIRRRDVKVVTFALPNPGGLIKTLWHCSGTALELSRQNSNYDRERICTEWANSNCKYENVRLKVIESHMFNLFRKKSDSITPQLPKLFLKIICKRVPTN